MQYMTSEERLIALDKMTNTRDLGGYETQEGYYTKSHHYIRASSPLKNIDLSTCLIEAIEAAPQDVSGVIIDEMQSSAFIHLLNIKIKEA